MAKIRERFRGGVPGQDKSLDRRTRSDGSNSPYRRSTDPVTKRDVLSKKLIIIVVAVINAFYLVGDVLISEQVTLCPL